MNSANHAHRLEPPNGLPHLVLPPLDQAASYRAHAHGAIHKIYPHGIQFIDQMAEAEGIMAMGAGGLALVSFWLFAVTLLEGGTVGPSWFALSISLLSLFFARLDFIGYRYQPVLFNRAAGKVHVFLDEGTAIWEFWRWFGLTRHSIHTYDWACVRGEVAELTVLGHNYLPRKEILLMLAFTESPGSHRVTARVGVGYTDMYVGTEAAEQRFEHIRRYMQQDGPPLVPGDHLYENQSKLSLWAALTWNQPLIGPGSLGYWTGSAVNGAWFLSIPFGLLCLTVLPLTVPGGLLRALSHWSKAEPKWSAEILASVGGASLGGDKLAALIQPAPTLRRRPPPDAGKPTPTFTLKQRRAAEKERKRLRGGG
jgi:hypothetical protein